MEARTLWPRGGTGQITCGDPVPLWEGQTQGRKGGLGRSGPENLVIGEAGAVCLEKRPGLPGNL